MLGLVGTEISWFTSYLSDHFQRAKYNDSYSNWGLVKDGIPEKATPARLKSIFMFTIIFLHKIIVMIDDTFGHNICLALAALGPLLFLAYVNNLSFPNCLWKFA